MLLLVRGSVVGIWTFMQVGPVLVLEPLQVTCK